MRASPAPVASALSVHPPAAALREFVSCYWWGRDNTEPTHTVLPDGAVDVVIARGDGARRCWVYGTTTSRTDVALAPRHDYLGIRFRPGAARHFLKASAHELTDTQESADGLLGLELPDEVTALPPSHLVAALDDLFRKHLSRVDPSTDGIDAAVRLIERAHGQLPVAEVTSAVGCSRRQLERRFLERVGVPPKMFSSIVRVRHAAARLASGPGPSIADVAADAGYSDQSHMTHDFRRFLGVTPARVAGLPDAFLQDA